MSCPLEPSGCAAKHGICSNDCRRALRAAFAISSSMPSDCAARRSSTSARSAAAFNTTSSHSVPIRVPESVPSPPRHWWRRWGTDMTNGRQFSAWLGLVPRQYSTGGKTRLGHITKRGDPYLRTLLVMGARSVLQRAYRETDPLSRWALALQQRRGYHRACVAIAAKNARVAWALLAKGAAAA